MPISTPPKAQVPMTSSTVITSDLLRRLLLRLLVAVVAVAVAAAPAAAAAAVMFLFKAEQSV